MTPRLIVLAATLVAGCAPESTRLSGAETRGLTDSPRTVPAAATPVQGGTQMELVAADGTVLTGLLATEQQPVVVPIMATGQPLVGGGTDLVGNIADTSGVSVMGCRFRLLNPPRGLDGGGTGRCEGGGRRVDFLF
ncbi:hypothetical protein GXW78_08085 [Roseomonas terrae]|uniref:Uncharacterized protein n=1 Tax=Neoroseomonas terrae TaxID=424799 RepID=A0ABS5EF17_9PROT|nr:hypothetical protein [Neoroseomonas terrae]MBR0649616.1 hypothetical protein [Neoroseomonas terrae]